MREYELKIDEAFEKGLNPLTRSFDGAPYLDECYWFRLANGGLEMFKPFKSPFLVNFNIVKAWPFPQVIQGEKYTLLFNKNEDITEVYIVDEESTTLISNTIPHSELFEVADFGLYAIATNGQRYLHLDVGPPITWEVFTTTTAIPLVRTLINYNGQPVGGGVLSNWYNCDETFYIWGKIGEMDFTPDRRNEAGYRRCPYGGEVMNVRQLGNNIVGYSTKGITLMYPSESPIPTFGFKHMSDVGIINKGAVDGSKFKHVYVGSDYVLRLVTSEGIQELGYSIYMKRLEGQILVIHDKEKDDFYIGDGNHCFLLTSKGMTEVPQNFSALWRFGGEMVAIPDDIEGADGYIISATHDMGYRGQKTVFTIECDATRVEDLRASVDYSNALNDVNSSTLKPVNNQGIASVIASGNQFRFKLRLNPLYTDTKISYLKARYKMTDLRGIRGVYAPPLRGQGDR